MKLFVNAALLYSFKVLLVALIQLANAQQSWRLVGGSRSSEGRVEVLYNNTWGTVCDDSWDIGDARVICRQLGYPEAIGAPRNARFGAGSGQIWLDGVDCKGDESSFVNCRHNGWGHHDCNHNEDASAVCSRGCSETLNGTFGDIDVNSTGEGHYQRCQWTILSAGISQAVALVSVQELNLVSCSEYVKISDGTGTEVVNQRGCVPFITENLLDVQFGSSGNISVQVYLRNSQSRAKMKFAILKKGISTALLLSGWNVTVLRSSHFGFSIQWSALHTNIDRTAMFYLILIESPEGILLAVETVPGSTTTENITGLRPSTRYRIVIYGIDETGQAFKSSESLASTADVFCGSRPSGSRIVGGSVARVNSWPWQVMLITTSGRQFCGGSLVDPNWVVTASHCVVGKSSSSIKVKLGAHYRTSGSVGTEQEIRVVKIIKHGNFHKPLKYSNDIALIKLEKPAILGMGIGLVCLPDTRYFLPFDNLNKKCWITGWGRLSSGGSQPNTLMQAEIPLVSKQRCLKSYPGKIDDSMLCAGLDAGGVDTCQGDSGGPLVCEFNGTWFLEGVTSWGYRCAYASKYGVYAHVRDLKAWLTNHIYQAIPPTVSIQNQPVSALVWCTFDSGLCSGWNQSSSDDFDWTLSSGSTPSSSTGPSSGQGGSGKYMYIETSSPRKPGDKAKLVISVPNNGETSCLSFYYHMYGATVGTLNVYSGNNKVFNVSKQQSNDWIMVERNIILNGSIIFEGMAGNSFTGDIAIDSVKINKGGCPVSCNFDNGLCFGWRQSREDVFDWTLYSGSTPSSDTGPSWDHTSRSGKYFYIETSSQSSGDNAKLTFIVPKRSSYCLTFFYHMYGSAMGTLNVFSGNRTIFTKSGNQGNYWKKVTREVYSGDMVTFEGIRGWSYRSDIAIDDVLVTYGNCPVCGGYGNETSGVLYKENGGDQAEVHCIWKIGKAGVSHAVAIVIFERIYLRYCSEHVKLLKPDGSKVFNQGGCNSSYPAGTSLEVPFGDAKHLILDISLEYRWSVVNVTYSVISQRLDSAESVSSWNITVSNITSTSAWVYWPTLPLPQSVSYYLVRFKELSNNVSRLFKANNNSYYTNVLRKFTTYDFQVFAIVSNASGGNVIYASDTISIVTAEGVPSRPPSNVRVTDVRFDQVKVQWDLLPQQFANGRLLGYTIYYHEYYYPYTRKSLKTRSPYVNMVILRGLKTATRYQIAVAAFTSKGPGPQSHWLYVTTACTMVVDHSSGIIDVKHADNTTMYCLWTIGNAGISKAIGLFLIHEITLIHCSEYFKIFDGNGVLKFHQSGCSSIGRGLFLEIPFFASSNITASFTMLRPRSTLKVDYLILGKSVFSAQTLFGWNLTVENITSSSVSIRWTNLTNVLDRKVGHYVVFVNRRNNSVSLHQVVDGDQLTTEIKELNFSTNYTVQVVGVDTMEQPHRTPSANIMTKNFTCGMRPNVHSSRIVNGSEAPINSWPWQAMLLSSSGRQFCGGSLIHPQWVLTATHCIRSKSLSDVKVRMGAHYRLSSSVGTEQDFDVIKIIQHENYSSPNRYSNDIALLRLSRPALLGKGVGLVCLPDENFKLPVDNTDKPCWITGWGTIYFLGPQPNALMQVDLPLISKQRCLSYYPGRIDDSMICIGKAQGGQGACHGDSGGPLVCEFNGKWHLEGATSWGGLPCAAPLKPTVYANIRNLKSWIINKMNGFVTPSPPRSGCYDQSAKFCSSFAHGNFCVNYLNFSRKYCAKTCGFCRDSAAATLPTSTFSTPMEDGSTLKPSTYTPKIQTPSKEEMRESVLLKVNNMDIQKWDQKMKYSFKKEVAAAARKYCAQVQCYTSQSRRRRSPENVTFTADMVHILPGYPKQSDDSSDVVLLALYLSLPQGVSESSIISGDVLQKILMSHKKKIQKSIDGEILSVDLLPSSTEKSDKVIPSNVIIGASVAGGLLIIVIAVLIGCKLYRNHRNYV